MNTKEFREELKKIMPGYSWIIHRSWSLNSNLSATGIQSSGFNRMSTLEVLRFLRDSMCRWICSAESNKLKGGNEYDSIRFSQRKANLTSDKFTL